MTDQHDQAKDSTWIHREPQNKSSIPEQICYHTTSKYSIAASSSTAHLRQIGKSRERETQRVRSRCYCKEQWTCKDRVRHRERREKAGMRKRKKKSFNSGKSGKQQIFTECDN